MVCCRRFGGSVEVFRLKYILLIMKFSSKILLLLLIGFQSYGAANVLYGERNLSENKTAIYFDKEGSIYPDYFISDLSLGAVNGSLSEWYSKNTEDFAQLAKRYHCPFSIYSTTHAQALNDSIRAMVLRKINSQTASYHSVSFMLHGYRKAYNEGTSRYTSVKDYNILKTTIVGYNYKKSLLVELYWDGSFAEISYKNRKVVFEAFEQAQANADKTGEGLRKVLSAIEFERINLVSHSLGARVLCSALFQSINTSNDSVTPNQTINICLVAPAIAGVEVFKNYYQRNTSLDFKTKDNYTLNVVYNKNDFVLMKKEPMTGFFGPGPRKYGNTTLGCNYQNEAVKLSDYFKANFKNSTFNLYDASDVGKCHFVSCYCSSNTLKKALEVIDK
jgi:Alpha/beta hydrolase of unknown function (DUF900)